MNFYKLSPQQQKNIAVRNLIRFIQEYVEPYHPYYRSRFKKAGVNVNSLRTYEDITRLPVISKDDYRPDPVAFILQPTFPGVPPRYETAKINKKHLLKFVLQAILNEPEELAFLYRKADLKEKVARRIAREYMPIHFHASAGSTGDPTPACYTSYDFQKVMPELTAQVFTRPEAPSPDHPTVEWTTRSISLMPGAPHLAFFQTVFGKIFAGMSVFDTCGGNVVPTERQIDLAYKQKFNALGAIPSYMVYWMRKAVEMKKKGLIGEMPDLWGCILGGEPISDEMRVHLKELARELGCDPRFTIIGGYGMTETKWAFLQCHETSPIHLNPKFYLWELLDPETNQPVPEGKPGVLTFSHIGWRGTVFVRYSTGDLIQGGMRWKKCSYCGFTFPLMTGPIARAKKDFTKIKGTRVSLLELVETIRSTRGVRNFQAVITKENENDDLSRDRLVLRISPEDGTSRDALTELVKKRVKSATEVTPDTVLFEENSEKFEQELFARTGIKADYVVDKRKTKL